MGSKIDQIADQINNRIHDIYTARGTLIRLLVPFGIAFSILGIFLVIYGSEIASKLIYIYGVYSLPFLDVAVAFPLGLGMGVGYGLTSLWLLTTETCTSLFVAWNIDHLYRFEWFRRKVKQADDRINKWPWLKRLRIFAVSFITLLPFAGAGGIVAPIVGRFMGLSVLQSVIGVIIGSAVRFSFFILMIQGFLAVAF